MVQQLVDSRLEGVKLVHEFGFHDVKFVLYSFNPGIVRFNIRYHIFNGGMGLIDERL